MVVWVTEGKKKKQSVPLLLQCPGVSYDILFSRILQILFCAMCIGRRALQFVFPSVFFLSYLPDIASSKQTKKKVVLSCLRNPFFVDLLCFFYVLVGFFFSYPKKSLVLRGVIHISPGTHSEEKMTEKISVSPPIQIIVGAICVFPGFFFPYSLLSNRFTPVCKKVKTVWQLH